MSGADKTAAEATNTDNSTNGTAITVTINGISYRAHLNDTVAAQGILSQLPLTLTYTKMAGFEEKIGDLDSALELGNSTYVHDPKPGDIAYWSPQPRVVLYYGDVGEWEGIHVIGSFDNEDKEEAKKALSDLGGDFEATIALSN